MSRPLKPSDPAYFMLEEGLRNPAKCSKTTVFSEACYICRDPEFSLMGLPLCYPCKKCCGHVAADDSKCDDCGHDNNDGDFQ